MSKNRFRDFYLSLADERPQGEPKPQQHEVAAAVFLARACICGGVVAAIVLGFAVNAWVL